MRLDWRAAIFLLGTTRARETSELERIYREGKTLDTRNIDGTEVPSLSQPLAKGREVPHTLDLA
jgi:hypothetical protein